MEKLKKQKSTNKTSVKNSSANAVISLACAIISTLILFALDNNVKQPHLGGGEDIRGLEFLYYPIVGIPLFLVWLICGILGLKSSKRNLAIISLVIKPISLICLMLISAIK